MMQVGLMREADFWLPEAGDVSERLRTPPYAAYSRHPCITHFERHTTGFYVLA